MDKDQVEKKKQTEEDGIESGSTAKGKAPVSKPICYSCGKVGHTIRPRVFETSLICDLGVHGVVLSLMRLPDENLAR